MRRRNGELIFFGEAYAAAVVILGIAAYVAARPLSFEFVTLYQTLLALIGFGYVASAILAWTGFANLYRFSPTLWFGSQTYRDMAIRGAILSEGRDRQSVLIGLTFGLALMGTAMGLYGWFPAGIVGVVAAAAFLVYVRARRSPSAHP